MIKQSTGEFLAALRKESGYTQQEVAEKLNISDRTLSSWETGRTEPDLTSLTALAKLYGVTADEILNGGKKDAEPINNEQSKIRVRDVGIKNGLNEKLTLYGGLALAGAIVAAIAMMIGATARFPIWLNIILCVSGHICACVFSVLAFITVQREIKREASDTADSFDGQKILALRKKAGLLLQILSLPFLVCAVTVIFEFIIAPPSYFYTEGGEQCYIIGFCSDVSFGAVLLIAGIIFNHVSNLKLGDEKQVEISKYNAKLAAKTFGIGAIPFVILAAVYVILLFALAPTRDVIYETESWADYRDYMQTYVVNEGDYNHVKRGIPAGEYLLNFPEINAPAQYGNDKIYDLDNGFWGVTRTFRYDASLPMDDVAYEYKTRWLLYYKSDGQPESENISNPREDGFVCDYENGYLTNFDYLTAEIVGVRYFSEGYEESSIFGRKVVTRMFWNSHSLPSTYAVVYDTDYYYNEEYGYLSLGVGLATVFTVSVIYLAKRKKTY